jgi:four helix bundle protein
MKIEINQAPLIRKFMETMRLMNIYLNHFPKHERYSLCARIRTTAYAVYDLIVEGMKRYHKKTTLTALDVAHEQLRMQVFLAHELGYFGFSKGAEDGSEWTAAKRYMAISRHIDELGRMIGAWISRSQEAGAW